MVVRLSVQVKRKGVGWIALATTMMVTSRTLEAGSTTSGMTGQNQNTKQKKNFLGKNVGL